MKKMDTLIWLGFSLPNMIGGLAGGVLAVAVLRPTDPFTMLANLLIGCIMGNYFGEMAAGYIDHGLHSEQAAVIVGGCGTPLCNAVIEFAKRWQPSKGGAS